MAVKKKNTVERETTATFKKGQLICTLECVSYGSQKRWEMRNTKTKGGFSIPCNANCGKKVAVDLFEHYCNVREEK